MSNRLKFYREQMAAFEGTVDPQRAIESGYYVPEPRKLPSSLIARIALRPSATHLLIGGIGSGKTTQLLVACNQLNEIESIYAHYIDVSLLTNISKILPETLTIIAGLALSELSKNIKNKGTQEYEEFIHSRAFGYWEKNDLNQVIDFGSDVWHEGILTKNIETASAYNRLLAAISGLKKAIKKEVVFLFDGLDRLDDIHLFSQLVKTDVKTISEAGIGLVLVGPLMTAYSQYRDIIEPALTYTTYRPCFDLANEPEASIFFEKILRVRSKEGFIEPSALHDLTYYSGGVLRDMINLTQSSIEEAYLSDEDTLNQMHVEAAVNSFGRAKLLGVSNQEIEILNQVANTEDFIPRTDEEIRLLITGRILEYQYPARRFAVHPTLKPLL